MLVTLDRAVVLMYVSFVQPLRKLLPMLVTFESPVVLIDVRNVHPARNVLPMLVTFIRPVVSILVIDVQLLEHSSPSMVVFPLAFISLTFPDAPPQFDWVQLLISISVDWALHATIRRVNARRTCFQNFKVISFFVCVFLENLFFFMKFLHI